MRSLFWVLLVVLINSTPAISSDWSVLPEAIGGTAPQDLMSDYLRRLTYEAFDQREARYEELKTPEQLQAHQKKMKEFFLEQLGGFPERSPLNAEIVDRREFEDYRMEKIIYQSMPQNYVTAVLYLPHARAPYPAVLFPCGHSSNGKASEVYQRACILLAQNGFAVLCYDPIDQGERYQLLNDDGSPQIGGTIGHTMTGVGSILLGRNTSTYRIWDGMRGIDYLVSRSDIDPRRIGCTGNSGGGTLTSYIMALDERVACAVPSCYITTLRHQAPQDAEQNIHGQIAFGMDHADYIMMRAPKPTLLSTATRDFFDIHGAWYAFRQAKRFYTRLGFAERVDLIETDAEHGFSLQLREGMTRWMLRWMRGIDAPVLEADFPILTDEEIQVSPQGQVMLMDGAKSVYDFNFQLEKEYANARRQYWQDAGREKALQKVRDLIGVQPAGDMPTFQDVAPIGEIEREGYSIVKLMLTPQDGIVMPALLCGDKSRIASESILYVDGAGKEAAAAPGGLIEQWVKEGKNVLAVDLRGLGETAKPRNDSEWHRYFGADWQDYFSAYMLNKTYVGMRVQDILNCALYLKRLRIGGEFQQVHLVAVGEAGVPALHAAALEPQVFDSVVIKNSLISWSNVLHNTITENQLINAVHGALQYYDLPDLAASIPDGRLTIENPVDALGEPIPE